MKAFSIVWNFLKELDRQVSDFFAHNDVNPVLSPRLDWCGVFYLYLHMVIKLNDSHRNALAKANKCEVALIKTVAKVEGRGSGFFLLKDDFGKVIPGSEKLIILFEGHVMYRELNARNFDVYELNKLYPSLVYKDWTKAFYSREPSGEHIRLSKAIMISPVCAQLSASYGMFQVMGFNFKKAGYNSVSEMISAFEELGEPEQLRSFFVLIKNFGILDELQRHEWASFAKVYNGNGYKKNNYDTELAKAYGMFSK